MVGDVSQGNGNRRMFTPPPWLVENTRQLGVAAVIAIVSVLAAEIVGVRWRVIARTTLTAFLPLVAAAAVMAFNYRVMTALTRTTNVAGAVAVLLGLPVVAGLAIIHIGWLRAELRRLRGY